MIQNDKCTDFSEDYFFLIEKKTVDQSIPLRSIIELTYRCNFDCIHCYIVPSREKEELSTLSVKRAIDQLAEAGCLTLTFSGGEPLLRRDFIELARYARKQRFAVRLFTNGSLIDENMADEIRTLHPLSIDISLYGASEKTYREITGSGKNFRAVLRGIENVRRHNLKIVLKFPLMRENAAELEEMKMIAREWNLPYRIDPHLTPRDDGNIQPLEHLIDEAEMCRYIQKDLEYPPVVKREPDDIVCTIGRNNIAISPYGDVYPCVQLKTRLGNILNESLISLWKYAPLLRQLRELRFRDFAACNDCAHSAHCLICPGVAFLEKNDLTSSYTYGCKFAPLVTRTLQEGIVEQ